jgi:hypothetical protein
MLRISVRGRVGLGIVALSLAPVTSPAAVLLTDNFIADGTGDTSNVNQNLAVREAGSSLGQVTYTTNGGNVQIGNTTTLNATAGDGNNLLCAFDGKISPDEDFNNAMSAGGLDFAFSVDPDTNTSPADTTVWSAFVLGTSVANRFTGINLGVSHFGILFRANGQYQAFDGSTAVEQGTYGPANIGNSSGIFYPMNIVVTDPTDGNPFDGVGETQISVYSSISPTPAVPLFTYTTAAGGYTDDYVNLTSTHIGGFGSFSVSNIAAVPEPTTLTLGVVGAAALLSRRKRMAR